jgi:nitrous oxidase accessory protein
MTMRSDRWRLVAAAVLILLARHLPIWQLRLEAPQYPQGLRVTVYLDRLAGDVREVDLLNHYVGMRPLEQAAPRERALARPALLAAAAAVLGAAWGRGPWSSAGALPAALLPAVVALRLHVWLRTYGQQLDPRAPIRVAPFVPPLVGTHRIAQFRARTMFDAGFYLLVAASLLIAWALAERATIRRRRVPSAVPAALVALALFAAPPVWGATLLVGPGQQLATLAEALERARPGDRVIVRGGVYRGPVRLDRAVVLEGIGWPLIEGSGLDTVVELAAPGAVLRGFRVRGSGTSLAREAAGVLATAPEVRIEDNQIEEVLFGIVLKQAPRALVRGNRLRGAALPVPRRGDLIKLWRSDGVRLEANDIEGGRDVVLWFSADCLVRKNRVRRGRYGLHLMYSRHSRIEDNQLEANAVGIYLMYSEGVRVTGNRLLAHRGPSGYGLGLKDVREADVHGNLVADNRAGFFLDNVTGRIAANLVVANDVGVLLLPSTRGVGFSDNSFVDNAEQVFVEGGSWVAGNTWSGNYWSDYGGWDADRDGWGDVPYRSWRLFEHLAERDARLRFFRYSPVAHALDHAARIFPLFAPQPVLVDPRPRRAPLGAPAGAAGPRAPLAWWAGGSLLVALALLVQRPDRWLRQIHSPRSAPATPSRTETAAIVVRELTKRFGQRTALDRVGFTVRDGEVVALWGPNGAGKTTVLRCLLGLGPFEGWISVRGIDVRRRPRRARRLMGFLPQEVRFREDLTVRETLTFYARLRGVAVDQGLDLATRWGLAPLADLPVGSLSGGMKQRLAIAVMLLGDPPVLLLDEPTSNLDPDAREAVTVLFNRMRAAGRTILFSTHRGEEVRQWATRVVALDRGVVVFDGAPAELVGAPRQTAPVARGPDPEPGPSHG